MNIFILTFLVLDSKLISFHIYENMKANHSNRIFIFKDRKINNFAIPFYADKSQNYMHTLLIFKIYVINVAMITVSFSFRTCSYYIQKILLMKLRHVTFIGTSSRITVSIAQIAALCIRRFSESHSETA